LGEATDQLSVKLGETMSGLLNATMSGLLNATFGNAVEIIVGVAALLNGSSTAQKLFVTHDDPRSITNCSVVCEYLYTAIIWDTITFC
jgi:hypothetical protein